MSIQDKLERTLREMHILISRGTVSGEQEEYVTIQKKEMIRLLTELSQTSSEMLEQYEMTSESRERALLTARRQQMEMVKNANRQAEDIYAASVIYTDDALGRIQDIIEETSKSMKQIMGNLNREMEAEKRTVRSNQVELKSQLEDLKDTAKYIKIIEDRNREIAREKAKKEEAAQPRYERKKEETDFVPVTTEIKINEEYFDKAGLTPEGLPKTSEEKIYEKPEIKVNEDYFRRKAEAEKAAAKKADESEAKETETAEETDDFTELEEINLNARYEKRNRFPFKRR